MSKSVKSFIAKLLVLCMVVGLLPVVGLAAGTAEAGSDNPYHALDDAYGIVRDTDGTYKLTDDVVKLNGAYIIKSDTTIKLQNHYLVIPDTEATIRVEANLEIVGPGSIRTSSLATVGLKVAKVLSAVTGRELKAAQSVPTFYIASTAKLSLDNVGSEAEKALFSVAGEGQVNLTGTQATITVQPDETGKTPKIVADVDSKVEAKSPEGYATVTFNANGGKLHFEGTDVDTVALTEALPQSGGTVEITCPTELTPPAGYEFLGWFVDKDSVEGKDRVDVDGKYMASNDTTLYAHWTKDQTEKTYTITLDTVGNGKVTVKANDQDVEFVSGQATVASDANVTVTLTPDEGCEVDTENSYYLIGQDTDTKVYFKADGKAEFTLTGDATIHAVFKTEGTDPEPEDKTYTIRVDAVSNGTVEVKYVANGTTYTVKPDTTANKVPFGAHVTVTPTADKDYVFDAGKSTYTMGGTAVEFDENGNVEFDLKDNVTIHAEFKVVDGGNTGGGSSSSSSGSSNTVISGKTAHGSFTISNKNAKSGDTVKITPKADKGYVVDQVTVKDKNGNAVDVTKNSDGTYSFVMPDRKLLPVTVDVTFSEITFTDVPANSWYAEAVKYVTENGLMLGVGDGKFAPDMVTSRAMVVTVLYRIEGEPKAGAGEEFTDVADGQWYTDAVAWASANGIVLGYDNGKFGPSDTMTREQLAAVMYRYAEYKGLVSDVSGDFSGYTDDGQISSWAVDAMKWATGTALITGTSETTLTPGGSSTRSQLAMILMRYCENIMK